MKVLVVNPNRFMIDMSNKEKNSKYYFTQQLKKHSKLFEIDENKLMEFIVEQTGMKPEKLGHTSSIYQNGNEVFQMSHFSESQYVDSGKSTKEENINGIACSLVDENIIIGGKVVIMRFHLNSDYYGKNANIDFSHVGKILYHKVNKRGVVILENSEVSEMTFKYAPAEVMGSNMKNFAFLDCPCYKFNLEVYFEMEPRKMVLNEKASRLIGRPVFGKVILVRMAGENIFGDLDKETAEKVLFVTDRVKPEERYLKDGEQVPDHDEKGFPRLFNGYHAINIKHNEFKENELINVPSLKPLHLFAKDKIEK